VCKTLPSHASALVYAILCTLKPTLPALKHLICGKQRWSNRGVLPFNTNPPRLCLCLVSVILYLWIVSAVHPNRKENAWQLQQLHYGMGFGFVPLAPSSTPTDTVDSSLGIAESHGNPFVISTNTPSSDLNEAAAAVVIDVTAADAKRRDDEQQLAACATSKGLALHGLGIESSKDVGLQTSRWCMGAYVSDLLKIKQVISQQHFM